MNDNFKLHLTGKLGTISQTELNNPNSAFGKFWINVCREADSIGLTVENANIDAAGKNIPLNTKVAAGVV